MKLTKKQTEKFIVVLILEYFLWTDAAYGKADEITAIDSPMISMQENICFHFWFNIRVRLLSFLRKNMI